MTQNKQHPDCNVTAGFLVSGNSRICVQWVESMLEKCSQVASVFKNVSYAKVRE